MSAIQYSHSSCVARQLLMTCCTYLAHHELESVIIIIIIIIIVVVITNDLHSVPCNVAHVQVWSEWGSDCMVCSI